MRRASWSREGSEKMKCTFCSKNIAQGTGKIIVDNRGKLFYFCSTKCEKNLLKLNRKPRTTRWTGEFQREKKGG